MAPDSAPRGGGRRRRHRGDALDGAAILSDIGHSAARLPTLVDLGGVGVAGWAELVATMLVVLAAIDLAWASAAVGARRLFASRRGMRVADRLSASMMAGAAAAVAAR